MDNIIIRLAGQDFPIAPPPFGKLRKIIGAFNRMQQNGDALTETDDAALVIGLLIDKTPAEVDEMAINFKEMIEVMKVVPAICGLELSPSSGEVEAVTTGTASTAI